MTLQRDAVRRLRVAVVGAGGHSYRVLLPLLTYLPVELVAVCDPQESLAQATARQYGAAAHSDTAAMYRAERLDAVLIAVSPGLHPRLCLEALAAGLHVWCEKPIAFAASEVDALIAARGRRTVMVGYKKAFMPTVRRVREVLTLPGSGRLLSLLGEYPMAMPTDGAQVLAGRRPTNWLANGCHPLSALLAMGGPVAAVTTHLGASGAGCVVLEFAGGAIGNLHLCEGMRGVHERYEVFAQGAHLTIENNLSVTWHRGGEGRAPGDFVPAALDGTGSVTWGINNAFARLDNRMEMTQGFHGELAHFCERALAGLPVEDGSLEFARQVCAVYEAALRSGGMRAVVDG